jgi:DNA-binding MarR family transcriptional regulator
MSTPKNMNVEGLLGYRLKKTQHALRIAMDEALKSIELTTPGYAVLAQLELENGISNAELARRSFITAQTMHGIVSNLERRALIKRKSSNSHGRILLLELTKKGRNIVSSAHEIIGVVETRMLSTIKDEHKVQLESLLLECFNNLNNAVQK